MMSKGSSSCAVLLYQLQKLACQQLLAFKEAWRTEQTLAFLVPKGSLPFLARGVWGEVPAGWASQSPPWGTQRWRLLCFACNQTSARGCSTYAPGKAAKRPADETSIFNMPLQITLCCSAHVLWMTVKINASILMYQL